MNYDERQIQKLYGGVLSAISDNLERGEDERIRESIAVVAENVYHRLPSGDYGRGDVRRTIERILDERAEPQPEPEPDTNETRHAVCRSLAVASGIDYAGANWEACKAHARVVFLRLGEQRAELPFVIDTVDLACAFDDLAREQEKAAQLGCGGSTGRPPVGNLRPTIDRFDYALGAWAFYSVWHTGQWSDFYRRLCLVTRALEPGVGMRLDNVTDPDRALERGYHGAHEVYAALCDKHDCHEHLSQQRYSRD